MLSVGIFEDMRIARHASFQSLFIHFYSQQLYCVQVGHILHGKIINNGFLQFEQYLPSIAS